MGVRGRDKEIIKEIIEKAIKKGYVNGDVIEFRLKDIGTDEIKRKGGMKFCMRTSKRIFKVKKDSTGVNIYSIDYEVVRCYGDKELEEMFKRKILGSKKS